ncbi:probable transmembrane protein [Ralstonia pseudosolanacearum GMI1000]|nr:probable transmembrane protein [Ralstonia pseudosolanacearum GMI1000]
MACRDHHDNRCLMPFHPSRYTRLILGLLWSSAFMAMLAHLLYGEVSLRQQASRLLQDLTASTSVPALRPVPI